MLTMQDFWIHLGVSVALILIGLLVLVAGIPLIAGALIVAGVGNAGWIMWKADRQIKAARR